MPVSSELRSSLVQLSVILLIGVISVALAAALGYLWLRTSTGSNTFEGACGYASVGAALGMGILIAAALFVTATMVYLKHVRATELAAGRNPNTTTGMLSKTEIICWTGTFGLVVAVYVLQYGVTGLVVFADVDLPPESIQVASWLKWPALILHCVFVYIAARRIARGQELVWVAVAGVAAPIGTIGAFWYLQHLQRRGPTITA